MGVLVLLWGLLLGRGIWCLTGPSRVSVRVGGRLTVRCVYDDGFQDYIKYWCKGESSKYCDVQIKTEGSNEVPSGRLIIKDNPYSRSFTVTIKDVSYYDDDYYYCGIERNARDNMHMVTVDVLPGACQVTNPWTDIVDFPSSFTELEVSSVVEVPCQERYKKKNIMLQCREKSGEFVLSPRSHSDYCVGVCRKASPWTHMVDFPENFTEILVNSSVVVSCQQEYREKNITLQCREESGQFLLSPADGDTPCVGVCRKGSPWTHMVDFPENFTEILVNSSVVVSCQMGYRKKNITLQCREESGQFLLSPADGDTPCVGVCRKASPWTHMVDFPKYFTEISVNSSVVVSCQQEYREKNITLQCREKSGQFLLSPADGDHCTGVCRKASPWTHMVDFPENFTEISMNSFVVVSCQQGYEGKNITLQCREESGKFLLSSVDGDAPCVDNEMLALVRLLLTSTFGFVVPFLVKLLLLIVILVWKTSWMINKRLKICRKGDDQLRSPEERSMNVYWKKPEQDDVSPQREEVQDIYANLKEEVYIFSARK